MPELMICTSSRTRARASGSRRRSRRPSGAPPRPSVNPPPSVNTRPPPLPNQRGQQRLAVPAAAMLRVDEQIFEVETRLAEKGREVVEEEREADHAPCVFGEQHLGVAAAAEEVPRKLALVEDHLGRELFVLGQ